MSVQPANKLGDELKRAVEAGDFEHAPALAEAYGKAVREQIETARDARERAAIAEEAREFLEQRLHLARVLRAHVGAQYRAAAGLASYHDFGGDQRSWQYDG
jgi:hypothetical protein